MSIKDLADFVRQQARLQNINDSELARRSKISRVALLKILNVEVKCPEIHTVANLAYAIDEHPFRLVSLFLAGAPTPSRSDWNRNEKKDSSHLIRELTYANGPPVAAEQKFTRVWELANVGRIPWLGRKLVCQTSEFILYKKVGDEFVPFDCAVTPEITELPIPDTMPGETVTLEVGFSAPTALACQPAYWKMVGRDGNLSFPELEGLKCCVS